MIFFKYHALGNTYLILDTDTPPTPAQIRDLCDSAKGVGADGILIGSPNPDHEDSFFLRIFNPDGSEAQKSGNGLRIFARYLWDDLDIDDQPITIQTAGGTVSAQVQDPHQDVTVNLGPVRQLTVGNTLSLAEQAHTYHFVDLGNPHCVLIVPQATAVLAQTLGPTIETHPLFPDRTNVQFVQIIDRETIRLEIWERGAGYTQSSGTSASAAMAVAHALDHCNRQVRVQMAGGTLHVTLTEQDELVISGPVTKICEGRLSQDVWPEQEVC